MPWGTGWGAHNHTGRAPSDAEQLLRDRILRATKPETETSVKDSLFTSIISSLKKRYNTRPHMTIDVLKERLTRRDPRVLSLSLELIDACLRECGEGPMRALVAERLLESIVEIASGNGRSREMPVSLRDQAFQLLEKWTQAQNISSRSPGYVSARTKAVELRRIGKRSPGTSQEFSAYATAKTPHAQNVGTSQPISAYGTVNTYTPTSTNRTRPAYPSPSITTPPPTTATSSTTSQHFPPPDYPAPPTPPVSGSAASSLSSTSGSIFGTKLLTDQENIDPDVATMLRASRRMMMSVPLDENLIGKEKHRRWKSEYEIELTTKRLQRKPQGLPPQHLRPPHHRPQTPISAQAAYATITPNYYGSNNMSPHQYQTIYTRYHSTPGHQRLPTHPSMQPQHSPLYSTNSRPAYSPPYSTTVPMGASHPGYGAQFATVQGKAEPPPYARVLGYKTRGPNNVESRGRKASHRRSRSHDLSDVAMSLPASKQKSGTPPVSKDGRKSFDQP